MKKEKKMKKKKYKIQQKLTLFTMGIVCSAGLFVATAGSAHATPAEHINPGIVLRDAAGAVIPYGGTAAFSLKETCGACHDGTSYATNGVSYDAIEKHGYHSQMGANQLYGWNSWNPDSTNKYLRGPGAKSKNWVQSPGHVGKW